ncbi:MAG: hypothetical protein ACHREM_29085 [Polyangiales bacterium]
MYCDGVGCDKRGPQAAYDNPDDVIEQAEAAGWELDGGVVDLCPECRAAVKPAKKSRSRK